MDPKGTVRTRPVCRGQVQNAVMPRKSKIRWQRVRRCNFRASCNRPKSYKNIWNLPDEILSHIFKSLHVKDLLNVISTHPDFYDLINNSPSIWASVSFQDVWPSSKTIQHFERAASAGNVEALIKAGVAYLYNEGFPGDFEGKKITTNGENAADMFCKVERLTPNVSPFTWLFIRPPWAVRGACCKECVFNNMKKYVEKTNDPSIEVCIAKTLQLLDHENAEAEMVAYLEAGSDHGSSVASHLLWKHKYADRVLDKGGELQSMRSLREVAKLGFLDSQLELCHAYVSGKYGGYTHEQAAAYVRNFVQSARPAHVEDIYKSNSGLNHSMRYILMDWLVEVANMKDFESLTLHVAIQLVDSYLKRHNITRSKLQLLGVSAMVLCSRFLGKDIITIREAAWLTDNTYKYEDVVRMMGEITSTLRGKLRVLTSLDYTILLGKAAQHDSVTQKLAEYVCELSLLQSSLGRYSQSQIASASILLARLTLKQDNPWCQSLQDFTGYRLEDLISCTLTIHDRCFQENAVVDHRAVKLQAVKIRYAEAQLHAVSKIQIIDGLLLCQMMSLCSGYDQTPPSPKSPQPNSPRDLIASPARSGRTHAARPCQIDPDRQQAATPTMGSPSEEHCPDDSPPYPHMGEITDDEEETDEYIDTSCDMLDDSMMSEIDRLNESTISGYDGDKEDEGEVSAELEAYDSDADLESLWCLDRMKTLPEPQSHDEHERSFSDDENVLWSPHHKRVCHAPSVAHQVVNTRSMRKVKRSQAQTRCDAASAASGDNTENQPSCSGSVHSLPQPFFVAHGVKRTALRNVSINIRPLGRSAPVKRKSPPHPSRIQRKKPNELLS